jgi:hypothetical protein
MPIEHSGGIPNLAFEGGGHGEQSSPVGTVEFDYDALDSDEERLAEAVLTQQDVKPILAAIVERESSLAAQEAVSAVIMLVLDAANPRTQSEQIGWASGMYTSSGVSMPELAKRHGLTKQAFQQAVRRIRENLGLRQTRAMRSAEAKQHMSVSYHKGKKTPPTKLFKFNPKRGAADLYRYYKQQAAIVPCKDWSKARKSATLNELMPLVQFSLDLHRNAPQQAAGIN